jgi:hypothetical protein
LIGQALLHRLPFGGGGSVEMKMIDGDKCRDKKGKSLKPIPVTITKKHMSFHGHLAQEVIA